MCTHIFCTALRGHCRTVQYVAMRNAAINRQISYDDDMKNDAMYTDRQRFSKRETGVERILLHDVRHLATPSLIQWLPVQCHVTAARLNRTRQHVQ